MSFNIRFDNPADGRHRWASRLPVLASLINRQGLDLLSTQEGKRPQLGELEGVLDSLKMIASHRPWIEKRMYPSIFYNPARFDVRQSADIWLSDTPDIRGSVSFNSSFPRVSSWSLLRQRETGREFFLVNTHLDHVHAKTRLEQVKVLIAQIKKVYNRNAFLLFNGDFNEAPRGSVRKELIGAFPFLYDPWERLGKEEESSFHKFTGTLPLEDGGARIDWILADKRLEVLSMEMDKSCSEGIFPSDHFPVQATLGGQGIA